MQTPTHHPRLAGAGARAERHGWAQPAGGAPGGEPITVAIEHRTDLVGAGLRAEVAADERFRLIAAAGSGPGLDRVLSAFSPRVAIVDLASTASAPAVAALCERHPRCAVVVLAAAGGDAAVPGLLHAAGAGAFLPRSLPAADVLAAIALVAGGLRIFPRPCAAPERSGPGLTIRERLVFGLIREGQSNAQIALCLNISVETVKTHVKNVLRKLGAESRHQLVELRPSF
ncbi:MAG TPA: response regulator transcription factor [Solirubrobacteraceae bacterium]|jgi:two-component system nitrate/nitrite response regulator NarL|nr:response regulator transcription factor [Solirubrobacteraceae bacterium]